MDAVKLELRRASAADAAVLYALQRLAFAEDIARYGDDPSCPANESRARLTHKTRYNDYYVLLADGEIVGGGHMTDKKDGEVRVSRIYVHPDWQGQGVGGWFLDALEAQYPAARRFTLDTPHLNVRNHHFYEKHGYVKIGEYAFSQSLTLFDYVKSKE